MQKSSVTDEGIKKKCILYGERGKEKTFHLFHNVIFSIFSRMLMNIIQYDILSFIHQDTRIYFSTKSCLCGVWLKGFFHHWFYFSYHTEFLKKVWTNSAWMLGIINHLVLLWLLHWWSLSMSGYVFSLYNYCLFVRFNCKCYWFQALSYWKPTKNNWNWMNKKPSDGYH